MEPTKLTSTWRNFKTGRDEVEKMLDKFIISEKMVDLGIRFKASMEEGGISDHRKISLLWKDRSESPPSPMKINQVWIEYEEFKRLVYTNWVNISSSNSDLMMA